MSDPSDADPHLIAGPLRVPLVLGPDGPAIDGDDDDWLRPLAWALEELVRDDADEMRAAVAAGEPVFEGPIEIRPPRESDDLEAGRAAWAARTADAELSEPLVVVRVDADTAILPRAVLVEVAAQMRARHEAEAVPPPWLFRPDPLGSDPHPSERATLLALEERGDPTEAELAALGLTGAERWEPKLRALLTWDVSSLARRYTERLRALDPGQPPEPPWLFRLGPHWDLAHPSERKLIVDLDREAEAIAEVERALDGAEEPPELIAHRARYLRQLQEAGLLDADQRDAKLHTLQAWGAHGLVALYRAALRGLDYLTSSARAKYNPDAKETDLLSAPVCLDIFRGLKTPEGVTELAWISWGEHLLRTHGPKADVQADQGDFPYQDEDGLVIVLWRKDAGIPALRYVALKPPVIDSGLIRQWLA